MGFDLRKATLMAMGVKGVRTGREVAAISGLSIGAVQRILKDKSDPCDVKLSSAAALADGFDMKLSDFIRGGEVR